MPDSSSILTAIGMVVLLVGAFIAGQVSGVSLARLARSESSSGKSDDSKT